MLIVACLFIGSFGLFQPPKAWQTPPCILWLSIHQHRPPMSQGSIILLAVSPPSLRQDLLAPEVGLFALFWGRAPRAGTLLIFIFSQQSQIVVSFRVGLCACFFFCWFGGCVFFCLFFIRPTISEWKSLKSLISTGMSPCFTDVVFPLSI